MIYRALADAGKGYLVRGSTRIVRHPITEGVEQVMAKNAVHLTVPPEAILIQAAGSVEIGRLQIPSTTGCRTIVVDGSCHRPAGGHRRVSPSRRSPGQSRWGLGRLRVGAILFKNGDFRSAAVHYHEVAERMPNGAEKSLALLHLSVCYEAVGKIEEARRYEKLVLSVPDIYWWTSSGYEDWAPMRMSGAELTDTTHDFIKRMKR